MSKEMAEKGRLDYVILAGDAPRILIVGDALPGSKEKEDRELQGFVENSLLDLGRSMARYSIREVPHILDKDLKRDRAIAEALSRIQVDDPNLRDPDPDTDQGIFEIGALAIAKAEAAKKSVSGPKAKAELGDFGDRIANGIAKLLATPMTRRQFLKTATTGFLTLTLIACGINPASPTTSLDITPTSPTPTEVVPTPTITPTETPVPPTATAEATATIEPTGVYSEVYTYTDFENKDITFQDLPFIDYKTLSEDDLSTSIQVGDKLMEEALPIQKMLTGGGDNTAFVAIEVNDPNFSSYIKKLETRPYKVIRAFRTEVNGKDFPGAIILVKNSDGSTTKLKVLFSSFFAQKGNEKYLNEQLKNGPATLWALASISGGSFNITPSLEYGRSKVSFSISEFYSTPAELELVKNLMLRWKQIGVAPADLAKYNLVVIPNLW